MALRFLRNSLLFSFIGVMGCGSSDSGSSDSGSEASVPEQALPATASTPASPPIATESEVEAAPKRSVTADAAKPRANAPYNVEQFLQERSAPADNAAPHYITALALISPEFADTFPPAERAARLAQVSALNRQIGELADTEKLEANQFTRQQIEQVLSASQETVKKIDSAQTRECMFITDFSVDTLLPHVQAARSLARHSLVQLYHAQKMGDTELGNAAIRRTLRLSRDIQPRGFAVNQLVSLAMDGMMLDGIARFVINDPRLTTKQCDEVLALLEEHKQECLNRIDECLRVEYLVNQSVFDDLESGKLLPSTVSELFGSTVSELFGIPASRLTVEQIDFEAERAACDRLTGIGLRLADTPYHELVESNDYESEIKRMKDQFRAQPQGSPFITIMIAASLVNIQEAVARGEAQLAGVQSLLALRRFEIEHGYLAETLEEAVAETALATVPVDAFSGQPMRYVVSGEKLTVYSTGKDLKDDGGQTDWKYGEQPGDFLFAMTSRPETKPRPTEVSSETEPASTGSENEAASNTSREWTSTVGTKVAAKFAGLDGETALLLRADGQTIRVPLEKLIPADRDWIEKHGKGSSSP